jgi:hypothetical protein
MLFLRCKTKYARATFDINPLNFFDFVAFPAINILMLLSAAILAALRFVLRARLHFLQLVLSFFKLNNFFFPFLYDFLDFLRLLTLLRLLTKRGNLL